MNNLSSKQIVINTLKNILNKFENEDQKDDWEPGEKLKTIAFAFDIISKTNNNLIVDNQSEYISLGWYIKNLKNSHN